MLQKLLLQTISVVLSRGLPGLFCGRAAMMHRGSTGFYGVDHGGEISCCCHGSIQGYGSSCPHRPPPQLCRGFVSSVEIICLLS